MLSEYSTIPAVLKHAHTHAHTYTHNQKNILRYPSEV